MKRRDLIKLLEQAEWKLDRRGGNHDIYFKDDYTRPIPVPRHRDIPENVAKSILKQAGLTQD